MSETYITLSSNGIPIPTFNTVNFCGLLCSCAVDLYIFELWFLRLLEINPDSECNLVLFSTVVINNQRLYYELYLTIIKCKWNGNDHGHKVCCVKIWRYTAYTLHFSIGALPLPFMVRGNLFRLIKLEAYRAKQTYLF